METLTLYNVEKYDKVIGFDSSKCSLCKKKSLGDEIILSESVASLCCFGILCPKCPKTVGKNVIFNYTLIRNVIYIQEGEPDPIEEDDTIQYNWVLYPPIAKAKVTTYHNITLDYNNYSTKKFKEGETDICCRCVCQNCGYECSTRTYMDS